MNIFWQLQCSAHVHGPPAPQSCFEKIFLQRRIPAIQENVPLGHPLQREASPCEEPRGNHCVESNPKDGISSIDLDQTNIASGYIYFWKQKIDLCFFKCRVVLSRPWALNFSWSALLGISLWAKTDGIEPRSRYFSFFVSWSVFPCKSRSVVFIFSVEQS